MSRSSSSEHAERAAVHALHAAYTAFKGCPLRMLCREVCKRWWVGAWSGDVPIVIEDALSDSCTPEP
eukprot:1158010-Pelagomonas_calceolata.AAC.11